MLPIGCRIYLKRLEAKLTQKELAQKAGLPQPNLSNIEKGKQDVTIGTLQKIAFALNARMVDFFDEAEDGKKKIKLTRDFLERLARLIAVGGTAHSREKELADLFKRIIVKRARRDARVRQTQQAWFRLRSLLSSAEIKTIIERVRDYRMRHGKTEHYTVL